MNKRVKETVGSSVIVTVVAALILYYVFGIGGPSSPIQQTHSGSGDNVGRDKNTIINQRPPYSATQVIDNLPPSLGGRDVLNLDNLATLRLLTPLEAGKITLLLDVVQYVTTQETPPVEAAPPTIEELPDGNFRVDISETLDMSESLSVLAYSPEQKYVFDMDDNKRHEIPVGGRTFVVTLRKIQKLTTEGVNDTVEYEFGIAESGG